ncbi:hypothetical protein PG994_012190 [Apiospora phragmitis]|uniref:DUF8212 domain-containing protein n=1 Tax=Apiospora phragmitis TaxID=2905665 RepID=A0ABR1TV06_9PEZI
MRLLDCATLGLKEFNEGDIPEYAILSHTWRSQEVFFEDMISPNDAELITPEDVYFYSKHGEMLFAKEHRVGELSMLTGISQDVLLTCDPSLATVASSMSWAARRVTTRPEDMAYCLLGVLDVNMPMLYGEGGQEAFIRLQEEVMKRSDDQSLFAWRNPTEFVDSPNITLTENPFEDRPYSSTNKGISIRLNLLPYRPDTDESGVYIALLDC